MEQKETTPVVFCRPKRLTCRWLKEMTTALHHITGGKLPVSGQCSTTEEATNIWNSYMIAHSKVLNACQDCKDILEYRRDYNDFIPPKQQ